MPQDVIHVVELETPQLEAGQALVEVTVAPINLSDVLSLTGRVRRVAPVACDRGP